MSLDPIFVTVQEAADALALDRASVYPLLDDEKIESVRFGRKRLVVVASLAFFAITGFLLVFVAAAILTPPDVISQLSLAIPMLLLYEASIFSVARVERRRTARRKAEGLEP